MEKIDNDKLDKIAGGSKIGDYFRGIFGKDNNDMMSDLTIPGMYGVKRECRLCGRIWCEYHSIGSEWMTDSICGRCRAKSELINKIKNKRE